MFAARVDIVSLHIGERVCTCLPTVDIGFDGGGFYRLTDSMINRHLFSECRLSGLKWYVFFLNAFCISHFHVYL